MARGRTRDFKAEYARRIANATAKGRTRQQARGHVAREHVFRKEREIEREGLAKQQVESVRSWYNKSFNPLGIKHMPEEEELIEWTKKHGWDRFVLYRKTWNAERRRYLKHGAATIESEGAKEWDWLVALGIAARVPDERWMYYH